MVLPARRSLTAEELTDYNNTYVSLQTLVRENTIKIITGAASMDTYEQFQKDLISYGAQKCIDYQQAALDRYNARWFRNVLQVTFISYRIGIIRMR